MRIPLAPPAIVLAAVVLTAPGCSLLAPSDAELMGGNKAGDAGPGGDGSSDGAVDGDAAMGDGGACAQVGDCCTLPGDCCQGLACDMNAGLCVTCTPSGGSCFPAGSTCCSGSCVGHHCQ